MKVYFKKLFTESERQANELNIDSGDFYHTYMEFRIRKMNCTEFPDSLKEREAQRKRLLFDNEFV